MLFEVNGITKYFGGLCVLQGINLSIDTGEIVGLIGPNGAGKTTLFNVITGIYSPNAGHIKFGERNLVGLSPHQICRMGIARTFQLVRVFPGMTALENVLVGTIYGKRGMKKRPLDEAMQCLKTLDLQDKKDIFSAHLTYSDRRLLEIARVLAAKPKLALLDEPLAGLNPTETSKMASLIREIRASLGISILWIEHKTDAIFSICDRIVVLDYGKKIAEGTPGEIATHEKVVEAYLGEPPK